MAPPPRLMLLDTASLYFRAFFGVPKTLRAPDGTPVNAVRGLLDFLSRLIEEYRPTHLCCCWDDSWRPAWRVALVPSYKAQRVVSRPGGEEREEMPDELRAQIGLIAEVLAAFGIAVIGAPDMEADDVIATLATAAGMPVDIVTGDRDLFALVDDAAHVRVLYTARGVGKHERTDAAAVIARFGVTPAQYADLATLRGDVSDGLPGVQGVGEKTAAALLGTYGDLAGVIAAAGDPASDLTPRVRSRLVDAEHYLRVARQVVETQRGLDIARDGLPLPSVPRDPARLEALSERWGLGGSVDRLVERLRTGGSVQE